MALRRSPQELARVLRVNAARYAGLPTDSPPYVVVNVPSFELVLVTAAGESRRKIVAGCAAAPTPLLRDRLTAVQLNPPWRIPERIAYQEIIPQLAGDPDYLGKHGIRVLQRGREVTAPVDWAAAATAPGTYQLEQTAGTENPLGRLKFLTASGGDVLVHDTPGAAQFAADRRALSHGCIRVEDALGLAAALLGHADGGRHLAGLVAAGRPRRLALPASVPVQTLYLTAWVDAEGRPAFRRDEYGCDTAPDPLACPAAPPAFSP
jgi:murein L,D-transpeptidase YcbB/YkuD